LAHILAQYLEKPVRDYVLAHPVYLVANHRPD